jgi:hypothetical protein
MAQSLQTGRRHADDRSLQELWSDVTTHATTLMRKEVELAKLEITEQLGLAGKAGAMFGVAGLAAFMALQLLSFAAAWGLAAVLPDGLAFLIVALVYLVVAVVVLGKARKQAAEISLVPQQTVETLKEDVQWARAQRR